MGFPTADMKDAFADWLHQERIARLLKEQRPDLAGRIVVDEGRPMVRIMFEDGKSVAIAKIREGFRVHWAVVTPDGDESILAEGLDGLVAAAVQEFDRLSMS